MEFFYLLLALAGLLLLSGALAIRRVWRLRTQLPYRLDGGLFSPEEGRLLAALDTALGPGYRVFGKVLVEDVIGVQRGVGRQSQERAFARLAERRFDFLICDAGTLRVLCAVDLIGEPRRGLRFKAKPDGTLERVCRAAGLPLVTVTAADGYEPEDLARDLFATMAPKRPERRDEVPNKQDEERLLAELAAAIRDDAEPPMLSSPGTWRRGGEAMRSL